MALEKTQKKVLVTGGSKGIGEAICIELAKKEFFTIINYHSDKKGALRTLEKVQEHGSDGFIIPFDITDREKTHDAIKEIHDQYGAMDALIHNAGITKDGLFILMPPENWSGVIDTSLNGFYNVTLPVLEKMIRKKSGSIVSIASVAGLMGNRGQANYSAAKAGLIGASKSVSKEVARLGIRVNVVAPGLIETDMIKDAPVKSIKEMIPMARIGKPSEVAGVVSFLCSEDASYVTGQVIGVNGGMI